MSIIIDEKDSNENEICVGDIEYVYQKAIVAKATVNDEKELHELLGMEYIIEDETTSITKNDEILDNENNRNTLAFMR